MDMCELAPYWGRMSDEQQRGLLGFLRATCREEEGRSERLLSVAECAERSGVSRATVNRAISSGDLRAVTPRGTRRVRLVRESALEEWMGGDGR